MSSIYILLLLGITIVAGSPTPFASTCQIQLNGAFPDNEPLILRVGQQSGYTNAFYLPEDADGTITFQAGEKVRLACPGPSNHLVYNGKLESIVECNGNNQFVIDGDTVSFTQLNCVKYPFHYTRTTGSCNNGQSIHVDIGFNVTSNEFFALLDVCFNEDNLETIYSHEVLPWQVVGHQHGAPKPSFVEGGFYPTVDVNNRYTFDDQFNTFSELLGRDSASQYFQNDGSNFLARGHFSPRGDYILAAHTRATYYFINVGPQFQGFNGGQWERVENQTRTLAINKHTELDVYTGPYGVLELDDDNNNPVPLYLVTDLSVPSIPVPQLYYKLVYERSTKSGVVLIGVNNHYVDHPLPSDYVICPDVCDQIQWYKQESDVYCCEVDAFRKKFSGLPDFETLNLLTG